LSENEHIIPIAKEAKRMFKKRGKVFEFYNFFLAFAA